jgi:CheY-like chemotaxis protein
MSPLRPLRSVLIADPSPYNADSLAAVLALSGYRALTAHTAADAFALAAIDPPDVVITEAGFPDGDGFALAGRLVIALPAGPILVLLTSHSGLGGRPRAAGFDHHFEKPADMAKLVRVLGRARSIRSGGALCTFS